MAQIKINASLSGANSIFGAIGDVSLGTTALTTATGAINAGNTAISVNNTGIVSANAGKVTFTADAGLAAGTDLVVNNPDATNVASWTVDASYTSTGISLSGNAAAATYIGGKGNDTLVGGGNDTLTGGAGNDVFTVKGNDVITDYTYGEDIIGSVVGNGNITFSGTADAVITNGTGNNATLTGAVKDGIFKVSDNDSVDTWITKANTGINMDAHEAVNKVNLYGADGNDTLIGNTKDNSLFGGKGDDVIWGGGAGNDTMKGDAGADTFYWGTGEGNDLIVDMEAGFAAGNDVIKLYNANVADLTFANDSAANNTLSIGSGSAKKNLTLGGVNANTSELLIEDKNGVTQKVWFAAANEKMTVTADSLAADLYISNGNGAVDFSATTTTSVNLNDSKFTKITQATGSATAHTTLVGGYTTSSTLTAGAAGADLWGGGSKADSLVGAGGVDTFWFGAGDGKDIIKKFAGGFAKGNDVLKLHTVADLKDVKLVTDAANSTIKLSSADVLTLEDITAATNAGVNLKLQNAAGEEKKVWFGNSAAATTVTVTAANLADLYIGGAGSDTLNFSSATNLDPMYVWLGDTSKYSSVENVKGTGAANDTLIGGSAAGTLEGGTGDNVMWGGSSAAQSMKGGTGADTFWFGAGDGKDVVLDYTADDTIHLYDQTYNGVLAGANITAANNATNVGNLDIKIAVGTDVMTLTDVAPTGGTNSAIVKMTDKDNKSVTAVVAANSAKLDYNADAKLYYANANSSELVVTGSDDVNLFLGNGWGATNGSDVYFTANTLTKIDATTATNANFVFAGYSEANNTFKGAGAGATTAMWGGGKSTDTMIGGAGEDSFYFGTGDGKDTITDATAADKVIFYADAIADLTASISGTSLVVSTKAGDTLSIQGWFGDNVMNTFQVGADAKNLYSFDKDSNSFKKKEA